MKNITLKATAKESKTLETLHQNKIRFQNALVELGWIEGPKRASWSHVTSAVDAIDTIKTGLNDLAQAEQSLISEIYARQTK